MKKLVGFGLILALLLSSAAGAGVTGRPVAAPAEGTGAAALLPAAREYAGFPDVPEDAWYAAAVKVCWETGLMEGTEKGLFLPDRKLTVGECAVLLARLHSALNGRGCDLPAAPEAYGRCVFLDGDGNGAAGIQDYDLRSVTEDGAPLITFRESAMAPLREAGAVRLTLVVDGEARYEGVYCPEVPGEEGLAEYEGYRFAPPEGESAEDFFTLLGACGNWGPLGKGDQWFLDACWYLKENTAVDDISLRDAWVLPASRGEFAALLCDILPQELLTPINRVERLPDTDDPGVLALYNAGILGGVDEFGTFSADEWNISRAEAAAVFARIVRPELRLRLELKDLGYTLTPLSHPLLAVETVKNFGWEEYAGFGDLLYLQDPEAGTMGAMTPQGDWLVDPEAGYEELLPFCADGLAAVRRDGRWGYIDRAGAVVVPLEYPVVSRLHDGVLLAGDGAGDWTVFNAGGEAVGTLPARREDYTALEAGDTRGGLIRFHAPDGAMGYLRSDGTVALEARWYEAGPFTDGLAAARNAPRTVEEGYGDDGGRFGLIDETGAWAVAPQLFSPLEYHGGYVLSYDGYYTRDGQRHVPEAFDGFRTSARFSEGRAAYFDRDTLDQGYCSEEMERLTPPLFIDAGPVADGGCFVRIGMEYFYLEFTQ